jgi:thiol:disulfide interchange protein DsbD
MFKKFIFSAILSILTFGSVFAAGFPKPKFTSTFSKNQANAGDIIEIIIRFDVPKGFHVFSEKSDCPEDDGPMRASIDFKPNATYQLVGKFYGIGDHMVTEDDVWHCSSGEFLDKGEFRQKIKVLSNIESIEMIFNGQICNESGCDNIRDAVIKTPKLSVSGKIEPTPATPIETATEPTGSKLDTASVSPATTANQTNTLATYRFENGKGVCNTKTFNGIQSAESTEDYMGLFILALISGFAALLTPCVFPMIPMTVSFFIRNKNRKIALRDSFLFAFSIIAFYTIIGTLVAYTFGATAANWVSTHWIPNIFFTVIFIIFAASFFGAFEIVLPSSIVNKMDKQVDKGGFMGPIFMAITIALVSFSCTGPIVGTVMVEAVQGGAMRPIIAMFGFSLAFALPFGLLSLFPSWMNNLPKSGGWLNSVKVVLGFIELAFALKFLSIPDQTYHWGILDREVYLAIWIVIFTLLGLYLLGKIKFSHDDDVPRLNIFRLGLIITVFSFVMYMIPGMWGAPLKALAGYLPPLSSQDFHANTGSHSSGVSTICGTPKYTNEKLHIPHGLEGYYDYDEALACAKAQNKPLFIDFTGHGCVNCRKMEEKAWSDPAALKILREKYIVVALFVDDKKIQLPKNEWFKGNASGKMITMLGDKNAEIEQCYFGKTVQPLYVLMDGNENLLQPAYTAEYFNFKSEPFIKFLEDGVTNFKKIKK